MNSEIVDLLVDRGDIVSLIQIYRLGKYHEYFNSQDVLNRLSFSLKLKNNLQTFKELVDAYHQSILDLPSSQCLVRAVEERSIYLLNKCRKHLDLYNLKELTKIINDAVLLSIQLKYYEILEILLYLPQHIVCSIFFQRNLLSQARIYYTHKYEDDALLYKIIDTHDLKSIDIVIYSALYRCKNDILDIMLNYTYQKEYMDIFKYIVKYLNLGIIGSAIATLDLKIIIETLNNADPFELNPYDGDHKNLAILLNIINNINITSKIVKWIEKHYSKDLVNKFKEYLDNN